MRTDDDMREQGDGPTCARCGHVYGCGASCDQALMPEGVTPAIRYGSEGGFPTGRIEPCHDCGVEIGGLHHQFCDVEQCPKCGGQLLGCPCWCDLLAGAPAAEIEEFEHLLGEDDPDES